MKSCQPAQSELHNKVTGFLRRLLLPYSYWSHTLCITKCTVRALFNINLSSINTVSNNSTKVSLKKLFSLLEGNMFPDRLLFLWNLIVSVAPGAWELPVQKTPDVPGLSVTSQHPGLQHAWLWWTDFTQAHKWDGRSEGPQLPHTSASETSTCDLARRPWDATAAPLTSRLPLHSASQGKGS